MPSQEGLEGAMVMGVEEEGRKRREDGGAGGRTGGLAAEGPTTGLRLCTRAREGRLGNETAASGEHAGAVDEEVGEALAREAIDVQEEEAERGEEPVADDEFSALVLLLPSA
eukprot:7876684-Pyramimonas_sp.AAC.1